MAAEHRRFCFSRRRFVQGAGVAGLGLLSGCALPFPGGRAPQLARVGMLKQPPIDNVEDFRQGMREFGYVEGRDFQFELRYVEREAELPAAAAELVSLPVDVIVSPNVAALDAARAASATLPIVMVTSANPMGAGLVTSLNRPGGNITGPSQLAPGVTGKRLQLLQELAPGIARVGVLWNPSNLGSVGQWEDTQEAAQTLRLQLLSLEVREPGDFEAAFALALSAGAEALFLPITQVVMVKLAQIAQFAAAHRLPSMAFQREFVLVGGLMTYGANIPALYRRAAYYVDRLLKGAKPTDLPVEQPTTFDVVINLRTAQALGLTIPPHVLLQATEVIQ
jgi:putative tryptophan/tyrosine transport system substrate-binding protein